jgi:hypothetical protein
MRLDDASLAKTGRGVQAHVATGATTWPPRVPAASPRPRPSAWSKISRPNFRKASSRSAWRALGSTQERLVEPH